MRRLLLPLVLVILLMAACGDDATTSTTISATRGTAPGTTAAAGTFQPATAGTLTVATNLPAPGFWNGDDPGSITGGYEYGIAQEVSKRVGLGPVRVINVSFDSLVAGQAQGFDIALSQVTITEDRAKVVDFSIPYYSSDQGIMVNKGTTVADAAAAKKLKWGVQQSTTAQEYLATMLRPDSEPLVYGETTQAFTALQARQIDAVLLDTSIVLAQSSQPGSPFEVVGQFEVGEEYGAILPKGSPNRAAVDKALTDMDADGTLDRLSDQFLKPEFGADPTAIPYITV